MITFTDLISPFRRQIILLVTSFLIIAGLILSLLYYGLPNTNKTTLYFSIKPTTTEVSVPSLDPIESTMKAAEGIAGWAKSPTFRQQILDRSGVYVPHFKRKITARKQDRINVFWTLNLEPGQEAVIEATKSAIIDKFSDWNEANIAPYAMTDIETFTEGRSIPVSWLVIFSLTMGLILSVLLILLKEMILGRLSFQYQIQQIFPEAPILTVPQKLGRHDEKLLERFILTFESPRLIGTFPAAEEHFSLAAADTINQMVDTPVLLVQLGKTTLRELSNMQAIFGPGCGIIVFEN